MLGPLGLSAEQERLYVELIARPGVTADELGCHAAVEASRVAGLLEDMTARGLVVLETSVRSRGAGCDEGAGPGYRASSPSLALAPLLVQQRTALDRAEASVVALTERFRSAESLSVNGIVEVVEGAAAVQRRFDQLFGGAREEVLVLASDAPLAVDRDAADPMERDVLGRGVRFLTVVSQIHLEQDGAVDAARTAIESGMTLRVAPAIPMKLIIADRGRAMLPLVPDGGGADALVVHGTTLVRALTLLFEQAWSTARPLTLAGDGGVSVGAVEPDADEPGLTVLDRQILSLLLAGLADRKLAAQLGVSLRTVERRIRLMMDRGQVQTRLQLGWHAARAGWLDEPPLPDTPEMPGPQ
ncbi:hypothetical protein [Streptomyces sp. NPDC048200]|uniref:hypothetical protein n=1 Tax=Streptomyces sp. NPDC048200 TaxID=3365512 RepID=UPI0037230446